MQKPSGPCLEPQWSDSLHSKQNIGRSWSNRFKWVLRMSRTWSRPTLTNYLTNFDQYFVKSVCEMYINKLCKIKGNLDLFYQAISLCNYTKAVWLWWYTPSYLFLLTVYRLTASSRENMFLPIFVATYAAQNRPNKCKSYANVFPWQGSPSLNIAQTWLPCIFKICLRYKRLTQSVLQVCIRLKTIIKFYLRMRNPLQLAKLEWICNSDWAYASTENVGSHWV